MVLPGLVSTMLVRLGSSGKDMPPRLTTCICWGGDQRTVQAVAGRVGANGGQRRAAAEAGDGRATDLVRVDEVAVHARLAARYALLAGIASIDAGRLRLADDLADVERDVV